MSKNNKLKDKIDGGVKGMHKNKKEDGYNYKKIFGGFLLIVLLILISLCCWKICSEYGKGSISTDIIGSESGKESTIEKESSEGIKKRVLETCTYKEGASVKRLLEKIIKVAPKGKSSDIQSSYSKSDLKQCNIKQNYIIKYNNVKLIMILFDGSRIKNGTNIIYITYCDIYDKLNCKNIEKELDNNNGRLKLLCNCSGIKNDSCKYHYNIFDKFEGKHVFVYYPRFIKNNGERITKEFIHFFENNKIYPNIIIDEYLLIKYNLNLIKILKKLSEMYNNEVHLLVQFSDKELFDECKDDFEQRIEPPVNN